MTLKLHGFWSTSLALLLAVGLSAQGPSGSGTGQQQPPTFRVQIDAVTMDVIVKDPQGRFLPDLKRDEFEVFEDGVKQDISSMTLSHGGRVANLLEAPPPPPPEGIILPPVRKMRPDVSCTLRMGGRMIPSGGGGGGASSKFATRPP